MTGADMTKHQALKVACELAQKFGFVSRNVIWKHLSPEGIASKYRCWRFLLNVPELTPYRNGLTSNHHLMLSTEYRKSIGEGSAVSTRSAIYFEHDEYLMGLILYLKAAGVVVQYWTEQELKMDRILALQTIGGDPDKVPDLVIDLSTGRESLRVAVECERTRKSQKRYRLVHFGYSRLRHIDLLLFGVADIQTESAIRDAFDRGSFSSEKRSVGYFSLGEFSRIGLESELRIRGKTLRLSEFLKRVCGNTWRPIDGREIKIGKKADNQLSAKAASAEESK
jgi:hypothetical protein